MPKIDDKAIFEAPENFEIEGALPVLDDDHDTVLPVEEIEEENNLYLGLRENEEVLDENLFDFFGDEEDIDGNY